MRDALETGTGRAAVPVRTTFGLAIGAMTVLVAALVFAASLDHLVSTPRLFGWNWDTRLTVDGSEDLQSGPNELAVVAALRDTMSSDLDDDQEIEAWSYFELSRATIAGPSGHLIVPTVGIDPGGTGEVTPTIAAGRAPSADHEAALGARTMERLGVDIGNDVEISGKGTSSRVSVVGRAVFPALGNYPGADKTTIGDGAVLTLGALHRIAPRFSASPEVLVRTSAPERLPERLTRKLRGVLAPIVGAESAATINVLTDDRVPKPADIRNYDRVRTTPLLLAALLALLSGCAVAHALITGVGARRREHALARSLGFTRRQVFGAVVIQASLVAIVASVIGIPLGIVLGRAAWSRQALAIGAVASPVVPFALALLVPAVLLISNAIAVWPAYRASRVRPALALRAE